MSDELPEPWAGALPERIRSYRDFGAAADISHGTAHRLINGKGFPTDETIGKVADAFFDGDRDRVLELIGSPARSHGPWVPPDGSALLDDDERAAIEAVIKLMLRDRRSVMGHGKQPAPIVEPRPPRTRPGKVSAKKGARRAAADHVRETETTRRSDTGDASESDRTA